jgi:glutamate/tyrosine decarboxylase-like PLP-dependent enzyme
MTTAAQPTPAAPGARATPAPDAAATFVAREVADFFRDVPRLPVTPDVTPAEIRARLARYDFAEPLPLDDVARDVAAMLRAWTLHCTHPRYFGLFNPSVHEAGVWADALAALYNPQLGAWAHAPAANEIERHVLRFLGGALGFDADALAAHFTTGGSEANQTAVLAALADRCPGYAERGAAALDAPPTIYASSEAHHSLHRVARVTGLGERALRVVPADRALRLDADALRARLRADRDAGLRPLLVVGTAGTTGAGAVDPLAALADVCAEQSVWFHVDAAWGGTAALSPALRPALAGIERADSVTWDAHKWLSVPMGAGMFFTRHRAALRAVFGVSTSYVPPAADGTADLYLEGLQWSRRFIGLKLFMTLAALGADGVRAHVERQTAMGDLLRARLRERGWAVVNDTPLPVVCFTHDRIRAGARTTGDVVARVRAGGAAWLSDVELAGERALRACVTSWRTSEEDVAVLVGALEEAVGR